MYFKLISLVKSSSLFTLILYGSLATKLTSTLTLAKLGLVWFLVSKSTISSFPTVDAMEKIAIFARKFGGSSGNEIHAIPIVVSTSC